MGCFGNVEAAMARALLSEIRAGAAVARREPPTDLGTWIGTWLPGSLHFGRDPFRRVRDARFLACHASFGARTTDATPRSHSTVARGFQRPRMGRWARQVRCGHHASGGA